MGLSISETKKNKGGRPKVGATPLMVRVPPTELERLDGWIASQPEPKPTRPEAIRRLVDRGIAAEGAGAHLPDAVLDHQIAKAEAAIAAMPEHVEPSPQAGLAAMDKAMAENELIRLKNKSIRRKIANPK